MAVVVKSTSVEVNSRVNRKNVVSTKRYLKILPMMMAGLYLTNTILSSWNIDYSILSYAAHLLGWYLILKASYLFGFCTYHRMFLWYMLVNDVICITDYEFGLPISEWNLFVLHIIVAGIFMFLVLYFRLKCR